MCALCYYIYVYLVYNAYDFSERSKIECATLCVCLDLRFAQCDPFILIFFIWQLFNRKNWIIYVHSNVNDPHLFS